MSDAEPNVYNSPHLKNLGIDRAFIASNADSMNKEFNRIYDTHPIRGANQERVLEVDTHFRPEQSEMPQQQAPSNPSPQGPSMQDIQQFVQQQTSQVSTECQGAISQLAQMFTEYTNNLEQQLESMQKQIADAVEMVAKASQVSAAPQPVAQPAPAAQKEEAFIAPAQDDDGMVEKTQEIPAKAKDEQMRAGTTKDEHAQLAEEVSIDKMFNFSGGAVKRC